MQNFSSYMGTLETYIMFQIKAKMIAMTEELTKKGRKPIALSMGAPVDMVPDYVIERTKEHLKDPKNHTYSIPKGEVPFLEAVAKRMKNRFGVELDPKSEIFSLIGSKEGIANFIRALINPSMDKKEQEIIFMPDPGYASYTEMIKVSGGRAYGIPLTKENNYMPNLDEVFEKFIKEGNDPKKVKALIINYPNNPLGCTCTKEYLQHCVDFCKKHNIILMSDNAYCDIYFDEKDKPNSVLECNGAKDIAVEFYSFSKPYAMTGWRLGWVCGNKDLIGTFGKLKSSLDTGVFKVIQLAGADLLNSKEGDEYIKNANKKLQKKLEEFVDGLNELGWNIKVPKATFYLWIDLPPRYECAKDFCDELLEKSGIVAVPGDAFGDEGKRYLRLSIVADENELKEVIRRMKEDGHTFVK